MSEYFITANGEIIFTRRIRDMGKVLYLTLPKELKGKVELDTVEYQVILKPLQ